MTLTTYKWSIEQWHDLVNLGVLAGKRVELLEGEIIAMSPEGIPHSYTHQSVSDYLRELFKGKAYIRDAHPITLDNSEPEPDIAIVHLPYNIYAQHHPYPENIYWVIEVSNQTLSKDLQEKAVVYARNQIPQYWIIDLVNNRVIVFTNPSNSQYKNQQEFTTGIIKTLAFPNIEIEVDRLLLY